MINNLTTTCSFVTAGLPDAGATAGTGVVLHKGDILQLTATVSANNGPAGVAVSIAIGMP